MDKEYPCTPFSRECGSGMYMHSFLERIWTRIVHALLFSIEYGQRRFMYSFLKRIWTRNVHALLSQLLSQMTSQQGGSQHVSYHGHVQGAIDLVQLELGHSPLAHYRRLQEQSSTVPLVPGPSLLHVSPPTCPSEPPPLHPITTYSWQDNLTHVDLRVPLPFSSFPSDVDCSFGTNSVFVRVGDTHGLTLRNLFGEIDVGQSGWSLIRPPSGMGGVPEAVPKGLERLALLNPDGTTFIGTGAILDSNAI